MTTNPSFKTAHISLHDRETSPLHTECTEINHAGLTINTSDFPTTVVANLAVNQNLLHLQRLFLTKNKSGVITLHSVMPFENVGISLTDSRTVLSKVPVFVAINGNSSSYKTKDEKTAVVGNNTPYLVDVVLSPESPYNGINVVGSPTVCLIPVNEDEWKKPTKSGSHSLGKAYNLHVLDIYSKISKLISDLAILQENGDLSEEEVQEYKTKMKAYWDNYETLTSKYENQGILVSSTIIYANPSEVTPIISCFQHTTSKSNKFLNSSELYSNQYASYAPKTMHISGVGTITASTSNIHSGYNYGQYSLASTSENLIKVPENEKPKTLESCVREISVKDSSGRKADLQIAVYDNRYGDKIVKHSDNLNSISTGTSVNFTGEVTIRRRGKKNLAIDLRISNPTWHGTTASQSNEVSIGSDIIDTDDLFQTLDDLNNQELDQDSTEIFDDGATKPDVVEDKDNLDIQGETF